MCVRTGAYLGRLLHSVGGSVRGRAIVTTDTSGRKGCKC